jgi:hypothetical protein
MKEERERKKKLARQFIIINEYLGRAKIHFNRPPIEKRKKRESIKKSYVRLKKKDEKRRVFKR